MSQIRLNIDGQECLGYRDQTVVQVASQYGIHIPTLCHDNRLKPYAACGVCVVEREGFPKLLRACSTLAEEGMVIFTDTERVRETRRVALDLLLSDHEGDCRPPCVLACPAETDCQGYVGLLANGEYEEGLKLVMDAIPLPGSIGRVCPHPCETACRRQYVEAPVHIAALKRFLADVVLETGGYPKPPIAPDSGKRVAVIGGGPGGLTVASFLRQKGHAVDIYDRMPHMGGMLRYGIPEYRLPKAYLQAEIDEIESLGIRFHNNMRIGQDLTLQWLRDNHDAVVVAVGAWTSSELGCPGEELDGVWGGIDFLREVALVKPVQIGKSVAVVGGGNTAMDACRTAIRLGASKVYCIYRRTRAEMPAEDFEIEEAEEEGVIFHYLNAPIEVLSDGSGKVQGIRLQRMELGEPDASGRRAPVPIAGAEEILDVDTVISAIGQRLDAAGLEAIEQSNRRTIIADLASFQTNLEDVFAIGDATNKGPGIAIEAIGEGKRASEVIDSFLRGALIPYRKPYVVTSNPAIEEFQHYEKIARVPLSVVSPEERRNNFQEVVDMLPKDLAKADAKRCLECGCKDYFECKLLEYANDYDVAPEVYEGETHHRPMPNTHPLITRNPDKCILCGLCVRVCEEIIGVSALGLVDRGFDTIVKPALGLPLEDSGCISCGQCVTACPCGALIETLPIQKQMPLKEEKTLTTCSFCSLGCEMHLTHTGNRLLRALPHTSTSTRDALLCIKGRFAFGQVAQNPRVKQPMMKNGEGVLEQTTYQKAYVEIIKQMQALRTLYGEESIGIAVSDRLTSEEILVIREFALSSLHTRNVFCFNRPASGLASVLGVDRSTSNLDELHSTQLIVLVESDIEQPHLIAGLNIRKGVKKGTELMVINSFPSAADELAVFKADPGKDLQFLRGVLKEALSLRPEAAELPGFEALQASLADVTPDETAKTVANAYVMANKAVLVFEEHRLSVAAATLLTNLAVVAGHASGPRKGILRLKANANSQGLSDLGIRSASEINMGALRGLVVFGEDVAEQLPQLDFLAVQELQMTATAQKADVLLPAASISETDGEFTNTAGEVKTVRAAVPSVTNMTNIQQLLELASVAGHPLRFRNGADAREVLTRMRNEPQKIQIHLQPVAAGPLTEKRRNTNALHNDFIAYAIEQGL